MASCESGGSGSYKDILEEIGQDDTKMDTVDCSHLKSSGAIDPEMCVQIYTALASNTTVTSVSMENIGITDFPMEALAETLKTNETMTFLDIGYNKITGVGVMLLGEALIKNSALIQMKIHRQEKDMGTKAERELVKLWDTNVTLQRLFVTLHDRNCNQINTKGEVRNVEISRCVAKGEDFLHLDPNRAEEYREFRTKKEAEEKEAKRIANLPISSKVPSTGGPYTMKQLTCDPKYRPADVDKSKRETYLTDEDFEEVFKCTKEEFSAMAGWKQKRAKKENNLH